MREHSQEYLRSIFYFEDSVNALFWKVVPRYRYDLLNKKAGTFRDGYQVIKIKQKIHMAHRLIWVYFHGDIPHKMQIDHKDLDRSNNALSNLRLATHAQNIWNQKPRAKSGIKGVRFFADRNKWNARIIVNKKEICLGYFQTPEEAKFAFNEAEKHYRGEFAYGQK